MSIFFRLSGGDWSMSSVKDPRWNKSGRSKCVGMFSIPSECQKMIDKLTKKYGPPPDDLEFSYMKD